MAANKPADTGLLLDDADDALVPIGTTGSLPIAQADPARAGAASRSALSRDEFASVEPAIGWATSLYPAFGVRAAIFAVTGISFGISRRERDLRLAFCALYRAAHDQLETKGD